MVAATTLGNGRKGAATPAATRALSGSTYLGQQLRKVRQMATGKAGGSRLPNRERVEHLFIDG
jgi:hypothetical protein